MIYAIFATTERVHYQSKVYAFYVGNSECRVRIYGIATPCTPFAYCFSSPFSNACLPITRPQFRRSVNREYTYSGSAYDAS